MGDLSLRPYQKEDVAFLSRLQAGALFSEQRTGKTPTALMFCVEKKAKKILIIAPASSLPVWADEFIKWTGKPCLIYDGNGAYKQRILEEWSHGLVMSYESLRPTEVANKMRGAIYDICLKDIDVVILDEAHRIKHHKTANAKAAFMLKHVPYKLVLTGTPASGKPEDVWSLLHFLYPNTFRGYWPFVTKYFRVEVMVNADGREYRKLMGFNSAGEAMIQQVLSAIAVQRKRIDVMPWLTPKEYVVVKLPLTAHQRKYLTDLEEMWETGDVVTIGTLDRLIRYRQICLAPALVNLGGSSPKIKWILQYLEDYPDRSVIIFSKFTSFLSLLSQKIKENNRVLAGATPIKERAEYVKDFQTRKLRILLLQIDAGKEALTLDTAEACIFCDRFPPIGDLLQAEDRFVATTEAKSNKLSLVYYLVMKDSYDESLNELILSRKNETDIINNFKHYMQKRKENRHGNRT